MLWLLEEILKRKNETIIKKISEMSARFGLTSVARKERNFLVIY